MWWIQWCIIYNIYYTGGVNIQHVIIHLQYLIFYEVDTLLNNASYDLYRLSYLVLVISNLVVDVFFWTLGLVMLECNKLYLLLHSYALCSYLEDKYICTTFLCGNKRHLFLSFDYTFLCIALAISMCTHCPKVQRLTIYMAHETLTVSTPRKLC